MPLHNIFKIGLFNRIKAGSLTEDDKAECIQCKANGLNKHQFLISKGSVKSLSVHLESTLHNDSEYMAKFRQLNNSNNGKIENYAIHGSSELSSLDKKVLNLITECNLPFQIINKPSFRSLFKQQHEQLIDESHYRKKLPTLYKVVKQKIMSNLMKCRHISCTADCWSGTTENFISLTAEGICENWTRKKFVLAIRKFPGTHSSQNIAELLAKLLREWEIEKRIHCFVTDSARNMQKAFETLDSNGLECLPYSNAPCAAHQLNLIVRNSFGEKDGEISKLFGRYRRVVSHIRHSNKAFSELKDFQSEEGLPSHQLIQEVATRWNSTLLMVRRLLEQRAAVDKYFLDKRMFDFLLSDGEWRLLEALILILSPFEEVSKLLRIAYFGCHSLHKGT